MTTFSTSPKSLAKNKVGFNKLLREMVVISPPPGFLLIGLLVKNTSCLIFIL